MGKETSTAAASVSGEFKGQKGETAYEAESRKVRGTVWKNFSQKTGKHYYKVSIRRIEFDADGSPYLANSFWPEDLKDVASVANQCRIWLQDNTDAYEEQREWRKEKMKPKKRTASPAKSPEPTEQVTE